MFGPRHYCHYDHRWYQWLPIMPLIIFVNGQKYYLSLLLSTILIFVINPSFQNYVECFHQEETSTTTPIFKFQHTNDSSVSKLINDLVDSNRDHSESSSLNIHVVNKNQENYKSSQSRYQPQEIDEKLCPALDSKIVSSSIDDPNSSLSKSNNNNISVASNCQTRIFKKHHSGLKNQIIEDLFRSTTNTATISNQSTTIGVNNDHHKIFGPSSSSSTNFTDLTNKIISPHSLNAKTSPNGEITVINGKTVTSILYEHDFQQPQQQHLISAAQQQSSSSPEPIVFFEAESKNQLSLDNDNKQDSSNKKSITNHDLNSSKSSLINKKKNEVGNLRKNNNSENLLQFGTKISKIIHEKSGSKNTVTSSIRSGSTQLEKYSTDDNHTSEPESLTTETISTTNHVREKNRIDYLRQRYNKANAVKLQNANSTTPVSTPSPSPVYFTTTKPLFKSLNNHYHHHGQKLLLKNASDLEQNLTSGSTTKTTKISNTTESITTNPKPSFDIERPQPKLTLKSNRQKIRYQDIKWRPYHQRLLSKVSTTTTTTPTITSPQQIFTTINTTTIELSLMDPTQNQQKEPDRKISVPKTTESSHNKQIPGPPLEYPAEFVPFDKIDNQIYTTPRSTFIITSISPPFSKHLTHSSNPPSSTESLISSTYGKYNGKNLSEIFDQKFNIMNEMYKKKIHSNPSIQKVDQPLIRTSADLIRLAMKHQPLQPLIKNPLNYAHQHQTISTTQPPEVFVTIENKFYVLRNQTATVHHPIQELDYPSPPSVDKSIGQNFWKHQRLHHQQAANYNSGPNESIQQSPEVTKETVQQHMFQTQQELQLQKQLYNNKNKLLNSDNKQYVNEYPESLVQFVQKYSNNIPIAASDPTKTYPNKPQLSLSKDYVQNSLPLSFMTNKRPPSLSMLSTTTGSRVNHNFNDPIIKINKFNLNMLNDDQIRDDNGNPYTLVRHYINTYTPDKTEISGIKTGTNVIEHHHPHHHQIRPVSTIIRQPETANKNRLMFWPLNSPMFKADVQFPSAKLFQSPSSLASSKLYTIPKTFDHHHQETNVDVEPLIHMIHMVQEHSNRYSDANYIQQNHSNKPQQHVMTLNSMNDPRNHPFHIRKPFGFDSSSSSSLLFEHYLPPNTAQLDRSRRRKIKNNHPQQQYNRFHQIQMIDYFGMPQKLQQTQTAVNNNQKTFDGNHSTTNNELNGNSMLFDDDGQQEMVFTSEEIGDSRPITPVGLLEKPSISGDIYHNHDTESNSNQVRGMDPDDNNNNNRPSIIVTGGRHRHHHIHTAAKDDVDDATLIQSLLKTAAATTPDPFEEFYDRDRVLPLNNALIDYPSIQWKLPPPSETVAVGEIEFDSKDPRENETMILEQQQQQHRKPPLSSVTDKTSGHPHKLSKLSELLSLTGLFNAIQNSSGKLNQTLSTNNKNDNVQYATTRPLADQLRSALSTSAILATSTSVDNMGGDTQKTLLNFMTKNNQITNRQQYSSNANQIIHHHNTVHSKMNRNNLDSNDKELIRKMGAKIVISTNGQDQIPSSPPREIISRIIKSANGFGSSPLQPPSIGASSPLFMKNHAALPYLTIESETKRIRQNRLMQSMKFLMKAINRLYRI